MKEITVFADGDSSKLTTWSNVPYLFTETLRSKGIKVNRVDIHQNFKIKNWWDRTMGRVLLHFVNEDTSYTYFRSLPHFLDVRGRIRKAMKARPNSDANVFLTFSFSSAGMTQKPTVLFCDWTYDHWLKNHAGREPDPFEKRSVRREDRQIEQADLVICLYPGVTRLMRQKYRNPNIYYLGNVVNAVCEPDEQSKMLERKRHSARLVFVGAVKYRVGARALCSALEILRNEFPDMNLDLIGMTDQEIGPVPAGVRCHGHLDKDQPEQRALFYNILGEAKVFINTTPKWAAFSAAVEAMYFYTPVVISPYSEFVEMFGNEINFGEYCNDNSPVAIASGIRKILQRPDYDQLCVNAHDAVRDYRWDTYIDRVLAKIEEVSPID
ncbi:MAG TPA: glycosyltransferase family 4 protein [Chthoniobacterales bacterium]|nr:glycosyltransferase family 4 protein [Chthoniobacterales bacterium]